MERLENNECTFAHWKVASLPMLVTLSSDVCIWLLYNHQPAQSRHCKVHNSLTHRVASSVKMIDATQTSKGLIERTLQSVRKYTKKIFCKPSGLRRPTLFWPKAIDQLRSRLVLGSSGPKGHEDPRR